MTLHAVGIPQHDSSAQCPTLRRTLGEMQPGGGFESRPVDLGDHHSSPCVPDGDNPPTEYHQHGPIRAELDSITPHTGERGLGCTAPRILLRSPPTRIPDPEIRFSHGGAQFGPHLTRTGCPERQSRHLHTPSMRLGLGILHAPSSLVTPPPEFQTVKSGGTRERLHGDHGIPTQIHPVDSGGGEGGGLGPFGDPVMREDF
mmetsp:Transcript_46852/g.56313  ORF Transcript_46852/g.56313 Transcript_46852/m.56313 type:complete len:201 (-) Transcript_46852:305-907(-)